MIKKPLLSLPEYSRLVENTEYRDNFFFIDLLKKPLRSLRVFYKILNTIWHDFFTDTQGLRGKMQILKDIFFFISKLEKIKCFNPDIVVVHFANARANPALFYNIISNKPYIIKMHGVDVFNRTNLFRLKVERAYKIFTISKYSINFILNRDKDVDNSKFIVHHCGISIADYKLKSVPDKHNDIPQILSVGRLSSTKGFDT